MQKTSSDQPANGEEPAASLEGTPKQLPSLTTAQTRALALIVAHLEEHGRPPTLEALTALAGRRGTAATRRHLAELEKKGYLRRTFGAYCFIQVIDDGRGGPQVLIDDDVIVVRGLVGPLTAAAAMALANDLHLASIDLERAAKEAIGEQGESAK